MNPDSHPFGPNCFQVQRLLAPSWSLVMVFGVSRDWFQNHQLVFCSIMMRAGGAGGWDTWADVRERSKVRLRQLNPTWDFSA